jgi:hypothetical protein
MRTKKSMRTETLPALEVVPERDACCCETDEDV